jgi:hypothetical protein
MPVFGYFAIVGAVLFALFFLADATLEKGASPVVTSERVGLPKPWQPDPIQTLVSTPAPEPDMRCLRLSPRPQPRHPRRSTSPASGHRTTTTNRTKLGHGTEIAVRSASFLVDSELSPTRQS